MPRLAKLPLFFCPLAAFCTSGKLAFEAPVSPQNPLCLLSQVHRETEFSFPRENIWTLIVSVRIRLDSIVTETQGLNDIKVYLFLIQEKSRRDNAINICKGVSHYR
mgnify:CR=1 FL=1